MLFPVKQNEENKKKSKQAALKAAMDLEEARKAMTQAAEQQSNNNASPQAQKGEARDFLWGSGIGSSGIHGKKDTFRALCKELNLLL